MSKMKIGDCVKTKCTAIGRYIGEGKALYVSAMSNDLVEDDAVKIDKNEYNLPLPSDDELQKHIREKTGKCSFCGH